MASKFKHHEGVILVQSMKIGTHKNTAIHSTVNVEIFGGGNFRVF